MSLNIDKKKGVKLRPSKKRGAFFFAVLLIIEGVFTFFLYLSLAGKIFAPPKAESALGVPESLSYQGRLTDTSGNPLGGTGTVYCFRYYIYDAASGGNQIWPTGTATNSTTTVVDGVFSDQIGRVDSLATQDFMTTSTLYLQAQVNTTTATCAGTWENLTPRQQITASAWSQTAQNIYGDSIRTNVARKVQIGAAGAGQSSSTITLLSLDVNNVSGDETIGGTCSNNGSLWYDSTFTRALVCENSVIQTISNSSTTIAGVKEQSTTTPITAGTVNFSASANITISQTGNTLQFSAAAPGGAGNPASFYDNVIGPHIGSTTQSVQGSTQHIQPFILPYGISISQARFLISASFNTTSTIATTNGATGSGSMISTIWAVIYSKNIGASSLSLASVASGSVGFTQRYSLSANATAGSQWTLSKTMSFNNSAGLTSFTTQSVASTSNINLNSGDLTVMTGFKALEIPFATSLPAGNYWMMFGNSSASATAGSGTLTRLALSFSNIAFTQVNISLGNFGANTNSSIQYMPGLGSFTTNAINTTASLGFANISSSASHIFPWFQLRRIT